MISAFYTTLPSSLPYRLLRLCLVGYLCREEAFYLTRDNGMSAVNSVNYGVK